MFLDVEANPNCEQSVFLRFIEIDAAQEVIRVKSHERVPQGEWCWVTGWTDDPTNPQCPALAQPVEDSGAGKSYLIFGGTWGIRLKPVSLAENWDLESPNQWGEPYLLLASTRDLTYAGEPG